MSEAMTGKVGWLLLLVVSVFTAGWYGHTLFGDRTAIQEWRNAYEQVRDRSHDHAVTVARQANFIAHECGGIAER